MPGGDSEQYEEFHSKFTYRRTVNGERPVCEPRNNYEPGASRKNPHTQWRCLICLEHSEQYEEFHSKFTYMPSTDCEWRTTCV